jgi:hypothetical protein
MTAHGLLIISSAAPMLDRRTYCNPYCNRADTHWYKMDKANPQIFENPLNKRNFRTQ